MTTLLAIAIAQETLRYHYSESATVSYDVRRSFKTADESEETVYIEKWSYSYDAKLNGGAARLTVEKTLTGMVVDGQAIKLEPSTHTSTEDRSPRGAVRNRVPSNQLEPGFELRLLRIADIEYPARAIEVGTDWRRETGPTDDGLPGAIWIWRPEELRDRALSGSFTFIETGEDKPVQAQGTFAVSTRDGWPNEVAFKAINTHQLGDEAKLPTVYSFSMKRR